MVWFYFRTNVTLKLPFSIPTQIDNLLVIETKNGHGDHHYNIFDNYRTVDKCKNPNIEILCNENTNYVIKWSPTTENTSGEVSFNIYYILIVTKDFSDCSVV